MALQWIDRRLNSLQLESTLLVDGRALNDTKVVRRGLLAISKTNVACTEDDN